MRRWKGEMAEMQKDGKVKRNGGRSQFSPDNDTPAKTDVSLDPQSPSTIIAMYNPQIFLSTVLPLR